MKKVAYFLIGASLLSINLSSHASMFGMMRRHRNYAPISKKGEYLRQGEQMSQGKGQLSQGKGLEQGSQLSQGKGLEQQGSQLSQGKGLEQNEQQVQGK